MTAIPPAPAQGGNRTLRIIIIVIAVIIALCILLLCCIFLAYSFLAPGILSQLSSGLQ